MNINNTNIPSFSYNVNINLRYKTSMRWILRTTYKIEFNPNIQYLITYQYDTYFEHYLFMTVRCKLEKIYKIFSSYNLLEIYQIEASLSTENLLNHLNNKYIQGTVEGNLPTLNLLANRTIIRKGLNIFF